MNISVNELVESSNSEMPRELKVSLAKNLLSVTKDPKKAREEFDALIKNLNTKKQLKLWSLL